MTEALNGANNGSELVLRGLEQLTGRRDLGGVTFGASRMVIEFRSAFRTHRAWCPRCLDSDEPSNVMIL